MIAAILDRLKLMHADITGVTEYRESPPHIEKNKLPICYAVFLGFTEESWSEMMVRRTYRFQVEVLTQHIQATQSDMTSGVVRAIKATNALIEAFDNYYNAHRQLSTNALPVLDQVIAPMVIANNGSDDPIISYDGNAYIGTVFTLEIQAILEE